MCLVRVCVCISTRQWRRGAHNRAFNAMRGSERRNAYYKHVLVIITGVSYYYLQIFTTFSHHTVQYSDEFLTIFVQIHFLNTLGLKAF